MAARDGVILMALLMAFSLFQYMAFADENRSINAQPSENGNTSSYHASGGDGHKHEQLQASHDRPTDYDGDCYGDGDDCYSYGTPTP